LNTSHFENPGIRFGGQFSTLVLKEAEHGESAQNGQDPDGLGVAPPRVVATTNRP
jgi:hypothetical protein